MFCPAVFGATFRWASSSNRIYVEDGGSATLSDIKAALPNAPLYLVDAANKIWLLRANLLVVDGSTLFLHGAEVGGDVNEIRLLSNNSSAPNSVVIVDADWGTLDLRSTRVTSWNEAVSGPDTEYLVYKRACVRARSRIEGALTQESTLNVIDSDISFLGYDYREGYGLTWQVVSLGENVKVFGTVTGSHIHECELGVGSWSIDDVGWTNNEVAFNTLYAFDGADPGHQAVLTTNNVHDNDYGAVFRWAGESQRIYVTGPGVATLTDIKDALPEAPLVLADPSQLIWYLGANLTVEKGAKLKLHGPALDGDVSELRLKSDNTSASDAFVELRADWGWLDIRSAKITSWDNAANGPDTETDTYRRAYIRARSSLDPDGATPRESRIDVIDSDIGYLGSHDSEAYGLVWKVIGAHPDPTESIFDYVEVYGDILRSRLHHNYFGMYSYGHQGGQWIDNEVDNNIGYGFDPHDDSDNLLIENNDAHHNGWHGIIASKRCDHAVIRNNRSWANGKNGIMLHRHCDDSLIEDNQTYLNGDCGIAILDNDRTVVRNNIILSNSYSGIRFSVGAADNLVENNEIGYSGKNGFYFFPGSDPAEPDEVDPTVTNRSRRNTLVNNYIHHCLEAGIQMTDGDSNVFSGNIFASNGSVLRFITSAGNQLISNSIPPNAIVKLSGSASKPTWLYFKNQPLVKLQLADAYSTATLEDDGGAIFDFDEDGLFTSVDGGGSHVNIAAAQIGTSTTVVTRNLRVSVDTAGGLINPSVWNLTGDLSKRWTTKAGLASQVATYIVGDLAPNTVYSVLRGGLFLTSVTSDSTGTLSFADVSGTTDALEYWIEP